MAFLPTLVVGLLVTVTVGASVTVVFSHSSQHDGESDPMIDEETKNAEPGMADQSDHNEHFYACSRRVLHCMMAQWFTPRKHLMFALFTHSGR